MTQIEDHDRGQAGEVVFYAHGSESMRTYLGMSKLHSIADCAALIRRGGTVVRDRMTDVLSMLPKWLNGDEVTAVLQTSGYTNIQVDGFRFFDCGDDLFGIGFTATGPSGLPAKGAVCRGIFKGATVRLSAT